MVIAKLIDHIWATRKADSLNGHKLMLVELIGGSDKGKQMIAVDIIGAGIGENVVVVQGSSARRMLEDDDAPVDAAIIGIIDKDCVIKE